MGDSKYQPKQLQLQRRALLKAGMLGLLATGCSVSESIANPISTPIDSTHTSIETTPEPTNVTTSTPFSTPSTEGSTPDPVTSTVQDLSSPVSLSERVQALEAGVFHSLAVTESGSVFGWGSQIVLGLSNDPEGKQSVPIELREWGIVDTIYAYRAHSAIINNALQLTVYGEFEVDTVSTSRVQDVSTSETADLCLVVKTDSTVWGIGDGRLGQLGQDNSIVASEFIQVPLDDVVQIECLNNLVCALRTDGTVWYWGNNSRITDKSGTNDLELVYNEPTQLQGITDITQIARGNGLSMLKSDGTVTVWLNGQISDVTNAPLLTRLSGAYPYYTIGISETGDLWVWGEKWFIPLPGEDPMSYDDAVELERFQAHQINITNIVDVACGGAILALDSDGTVWAWRNNRYGQVGNGTVSNGVIEPTPIIYSG